MKALWMAHVFPKQQLHSTTCVWSCCCTQTTSLILRFMSAKNGTTESKSLLRYKFIKKWQATSEYILKATFSSTSRSATILKKILQISDTGISFDTIKNKVAVCAFSDINYIFDRVFLKTWIFWDIAFCSGRLIWLLLFCCNNETIMRPLLLIRWYCIGIIIIMKNFNRRDYYGYHGSKRRELAQHAHSHGSHAFTHALTTSTQLQPRGAKRQLSY